MRFRSLSALSLAALLAASACSNDYDEFSFVDRPGAGGTGAGGSGGSSAGGSGGAGATGGASGFGGVGGASGFGGVGGAGSGGVGGVGAAGGVGGAAGAAGGDGGPGCTATQKLCATSCVEQSDPAFGCGQTGCDPCAIANAQPTCDGQQCDFASCNAGFGDCDGDSSNGCEQSLDSVDHCGVCDRECSTDDAASTLCGAAGSCAPVCNAGFGDCSTPVSPAADDGCETDLEDDDTSCGSCANDCTQLGGGNGFVCNDSRCGCNSNQDCRDNAGAQGSCNSGICTCSGGVVCAPGEACVNQSGTSSCRCNGAAACSAGQTCCQTPAGCFDLQADNANCGACGNACPGTTTCQSGVCL